MTAALTPDGWLQDGALLYRLTDDRRPSNRDEIRVTMADQSHSTESCTRRAGELLDRIRHIEALEAELAILRDSECDKIMAMSETQINALTRIQGSNPEDIAQLGRMTARAAIKDVEINRLRAELAAAHTVKRDIVKAYYKMYNAAAGYSNYCEDSASVRRCERDFDEGHKLFIAAMAAGEKA